MQLGLNLGFSPSKRHSGYGSGGFLPTDLPQLIVWLDAKEGVFTAEGNNFTDSNRTFTLSGFPTSPAGGRVNGLATPNGTLNGRNTYSVPWSGSPEGGFASMFWNINFWQIEATEFEGENVNNYVYTASGNTTYPWQATWTNGTATPTETTYDVSAEADFETVVKWENKITSRPSFYQPSLGLQPRFRNLNRINGVGLRTGADVYVRFNLEYLVCNSIVSPNWGDSWSYYVVSTPMTQSGQSGTIPRYVLGHSAGSFSRGGFGSTVSALAIRNSNTVLFTNPSVQSGLQLDPNATYIFSATVNTSGFTLGINSTFQSRSVSANEISSSSINNLYLGSLGGSSPDSLVSGNIREVLCYQRKHNVEETNQVVGYLAQKYGITL